MLIHIYSLLPRQPLTHAALCKVGILILPRSPPTASTSVGATRQIAPLEAIYMKRANDEKLARPRPPSSRSISSFSWWMEVKLQLTGKMLPILCVCVFISAVSQDTPSPPSTPRQFGRHSSHYQYWLGPFHQPFHPQCRKQSKPSRQKMHLLCLHPVFNQHFERKLATLEGSPQRHDSHVAPGLPPCPPQTDTPSCLASSS